MTQILLILHLNPHILLVKKSNAVSEIFDRRQAYLVFSSFPFMKKLLLLFGLTNNNLLMITTAVSFLAFALIYVIVYKITSNSYYHIVSDAKEK